jgi:predicted DCC family thiol-disulfide oxidoreductase YuxK
MRYVLYDDDCQFCSNLVKKTSSLIEGSVILFSPFNSYKGKELISNYNIQDIDSVIYIDPREKIFLKAAAVLTICKFMRFPYNLFSIFNILPNSFLNLMYNLISKNRMNI